jgi:hypothetical protein
MKTIACALLVLACLVPLRADILVNSDFTDGRAHWKGDAQPLDMSDLSSPTTPAGVTITLKKDKWTKLYQVFTTKEKKLRYSVTFKLSSDYSVEEETSDGSSGGMMSPSPGLNDIEGMYPLYLSPWRAKWVIVPYDIGEGSSTYIFLTPDLQKPDAQTLTGTIRGFNGDDEKILLLAFPPGEGSVTLLNLSLLPSE